VPRWVMTDCRGGLTSTTRFSRSSWESHNLAAGCRPDCARCRTPSTRPLAPRCTPSHPPTCCVRFPAPGSCSRPPAHGCSAEWIIRPYHCSWSSRSSIECGPHTDGRGGRSGYTMDGSIRSTCPAAWSRAGGRPGAAARCRSLRWYGARSWPTTGGHLSWPMPGSWSRGCSPPWRATPGSRRRAIRRRLPRTRRGGLRR
jgi:hypothetical protein